MRYTFEQAKDIVLSATYETLVHHAQFETFDADDIHKRIDQEFAAGFVRRVLRSLSQDDLVDTDQYDETSATHYTLSDKGFEYVEKLPPLKTLLTATQPEIPASNRIVSLDHNLPEYAEIAKAMDAAIDLAIETKPNDISGDEHSSFVSGLKAARTLWDALKLSQIQFEVGILMAFENAEKALKTSFKLVKGPLLMEALKAFYKSAKEGFFS